MLKKPNIYKQSSRITKTSKSSKLKIETTKNFAAKLQII